MSRPRRRVVRKGFVCNRREAERRVQRAQQESKRERPDVIGLSFGFFDDLHRAGLRFRMRDDPMAIASPMPPLLTVGAAGLFADRPIDAATLAMIAHHKEPLAIFVGAFGLAELHSASRLNHADAQVLAPLLVHPDLIDCLLRPEADR